MPETPLTDAIVALTTYANTITGESDTTLSDAVSTLIDGYGSGDISQFIDTIEGDVVNFASDEITKVGNYAWRGITTLVSVSCPNATGTLGRDAFNECTHLTKADFPKVTVIGQAAFQSCYALPTLVLPSCVYTIYQAMSACSALTSCDIKGGTGANTGFDRFAFQNCGVLQTLVIRNTGGVMPLLNTNAFQNTPFVGHNSLTADLYVPSALISSYQADTSWSTILTNGYVTIHAIEGSQYENYYTDGTPIQ